MAGELVEGVGGRNRRMRASRSCGDSSFPSRVVFWWKAVLSLSLNIVAESRLQNNCGSSGGVNTN